MNADTVVVKEVKEVKPVIKRVYDPTNNNGCGFRGVWEIYPDEGWDIKKWGPKPLLGYVRADDEFYAYYSGVNKGIINPFNVTFGYDISKAKKFVPNI
jgi:hypothetical protein